MLPLLALSYVVQARVLPFLRSLDMFTTAAIAGLVTGATLAATLGGWKMLQSQAREVRGLAARLHSANEALGTANVRLQELSFKDPVTDLYNRRFFMMPWRRSCRATGATSTR